MSTGLNKCIHTEIFERGIHTFWWNLDNIMLFYLLIIVDNIIKYLLHETSSDKIWKTYLIFIWIYCNMRFYLRISPAMFLTSSEKNQTSTKAAHISACYEHISSRKDYNNPQAILERIMFENTAENMLQTSVKEWSSCARVFNSRKVLSRKSSVYETPSAVLHHNIECKPPEGTQIRTENPSLILIWILT